LHWQVLFMPLLCLPIAIRSAAESRIGLTNLEQLIKHAGEAETTQLTNAAADSSNVECAGDTSDSVESYETAGSISVKAGVFRWIDSVDATNTNGAKTDSGDDDGGAADAVTGVGFNFSNSSTGCARKSTLVVGVRLCRGTRFCLTLSKFSCLTAFVACCGGGN
jgi:hypothetical protein